MTNAGLPTVLPMAAVQVHGLMVGVSAHVSRPGCVPATPVADPAAVSQLWVVWLGPEALIAMDATEPNYRRVRLPSRYPVYLTSGVIVPECSIYLSRHGHLINSEGEPRRLTDQATLISGLLAEVPGLMTRVGATPAGMATQGSGRAGQGGHPRSLPGCRHGAGGRSARPVMEPDAERCPRLSSPIRAVLIPGFRPVPGDAAGPPLAPAGRAWRCSPAIPG